MRSGAETMHLERTTTLIGTVHGAPWLFEAKSIPSNTIRSNQQAQNRGILAICHNSYILLGQRKY
jgi:hypothetical protein